MCSLRFRRAFTLIEVLVVVAILALLIAVLLPSLSRAKELAMTTVCKTRLDQMYKGHVLYLQDYKQYFPNPDWWLWDNPNNTYIGQCYFFSNIYRNTGGVRPATANSDRWVEFGQIYKYIKNKETYFCPKDTKRRRGEAIGAGGSYGEKPIHSFARFFHPHDILYQYQPVPRCSLNEDDCIAHGISTSYHVRHSWFLRPDRMPRSWIWNNATTPSTTNPRLDIRPSRLGLMYEEFQNFDDPDLWSGTNDRCMLNDGWSWVWRSADYLATWHLRKSHILYCDGSVRLIDGVLANRTQPDSGSDHYCGSIVVGQRRY